MSVKPCDFSSPANVGLGEEGFPLNLESANLGLCHNSTQLTSKLYTQEKSRHMSPKGIFSRALETHACNPSYLGG
jgi:hypothetical protein